VLGPGAFLPNVKVKADGSWSVTSVVRDEKTRIGTVKVEGRRGRARAACPRLPSVAADPNDSSPYEVSGAQYVGTRRVMAHAAVFALSTATLLIGAMGAFAFGLFWAAAALERWLDDTPSSDAVVSAAGADGRSQRAAA